MTAHVPQASSEVEFGNLEANLAFLDQTRLLKPGIRLLEIGTGRGTLLNELRARGLDVIGIDNSADRVAEARARYGPIPIEQSAGTLLPFPDATFDVVLSFDVFEHIADSDAHLAEVRRVLKPGGFYLLQTPNKWTNAVFETVRWRSLTRWREDHCALHSYGQLQRRFARMGFATEFADVKVVTPYFRQKVRRYLGQPGLWLLALTNPDRLPRRLRTNFYVRARRS